jgi:hypothetical protein
MSWAGAKWVKAIHSAWADHANLMNIAENNSVTQVIDIRLLGATSTYGCDVV